MFQNGFFVYFLVILGHFLGIIYQIVRVTRSKCWQCMQKLLKLCVGNSLVTPNVTFSNKKRFQKGFFVNFLVILGLFGGKIYQKLWTKSSLMLSQKYPKSGLNQTFLLSKKLVRSTLWTKSREWTKSRVD